MICGEDLLTTISALGDAAKCKTIYLTSRPEIVITCALSQIDGHCCHLLTLTQSAWWCLWHTRTTIDNQLSSRHHCVNFNFYSSPPILLPFICQSFSPPGNTKYAVLSSNGPAKIWEEPRRRPYGLTAWTRLLE